MACIASAPSSTERVCVTARLRDDFSLDFDALMAVLDRADLLFLCSPNNPTGGVLDRSLIERVTAGFSGLVVVDEAYGEFAEAEGIPSSIELVRNAAIGGRCGPRGGPANLVVLRTFSKAFGAAGIRLGYAVAQPAVIDVLLRIKPPYNVNVLTQTVGLSLWGRREPCGGTSARCSPSAQAV